MSAKLSFVLLFFCRPILFICPHLSSSARLPLRAIQRHICDECNGKYCFFALWPPQNNLFAMGCAGKFWKCACDHHGSHFALKFLISAVPQKMLCATQWKFLFFAPWPLWHTHFFGAAARAPWCTTSICKGLRERKLIGLSCSYLCVFFTFFNCPILLSPPPKLPNLHLFWFCEAPDFGGVQKGEGWSDPPAKPRSFNTLCPPRAQKIPMWSCKKNHHKTPFSKIFELSLEVTRFLGENFQVSRLKKSKSPHYPAHFPC